MFEFEKDRLEFSDDNEIASNFSQKVTEQSKYIFS